MRSGEGARNDAVAMAKTQCSLPSKTMPCVEFGTLRDTENEGRAQLVSMWVDPAYRRLGVGKALIDAAVEWNLARAVSELALMVTSVNVAAISFYERLGFAKTGVTEQYPNDPSIIEYEMILRLH